jgi:hypothetical protein
VELFEVTFSHGGTGTSIDITVNGATDVDVPEYDDFGDTNERFAYIKSFAPVVKAKFYSLDADATEDLLIRAVAQNVDSEEGFTAYTGWSLGNTSVSFPGGPYSLAESFSSAYGTSVPATVGKWKTKFSWQVIGVGGMGYLQYLDETIHDYYTVLDTPVAPMEEPWTDVLDWSCYWAYGDNDASECVNVFTNELYYNNSIAWETTGRYIQYPDVFDLTAFLVHLNNHPANFYMNCQGFSHFINVLNGSLGIPSYYRKINPGLGETEFTPRYILPAGLSNILGHWTNDPFGVHQISEWNSKIIDAAFLVHTYITDDPQDPVVNYQLQSGINPWGTSGDFPNSYFSLFLPSSSTAQLNGASVTVIQ